MRRRLDRVGELLEVDEPLDSTEQEVGEAMTCSYATRSACEGCHQGAEKLSAIPAAELFQLTVLPFRRYYESWRVCR